jgi:hypothetical protein
LPQKQEEEGYLTLAMKSGWASVRFAVVGEGAVAEPQFQKSVEKNLLFLLWN